MKGTIIYYGGFSLPDKNASANRAVSNGKIFDKLGFNTIFLGADYEGKWDNVHKINDNMFEECHPRTAKQWLDSMVSFKNLKLLANEYKDLKMIILYNVPFVTLLLAKKYFEKQGIEVVYDCTEWTQFTEGSVVKKIFKYVDEFFIRKFAHKVASRVIVISKMMASAYSKNKKILRLPPLVDINDEIWNQQVNREKDFTFCFAGFPGGDKENLDKIVKAFMGMSESNIRLNIVGLTAEDFVSMYPEFSTTSFGESSIDFKGVCTHKEAVKYTLNSDCYIFIRPNTRRSNAGFPTKFAESYTCGVPIITTNISDIKDYQKKASRVFLLDSTTTEEIANVMSEVVGKYKQNRNYKSDNSFDYNSYIECTREWLSR